MNRLNILICLLVISLSSFHPKNASAQINIDTSHSPQQLVQSFLIGQGVIASNISYTGVAESIGYFDNGTNTNLGLDSGIVLSSGDVTLIPGNSSTSAGKDINLGGNSLLQSLIPGYSVNDAVFIEFDFIPVSDTIKFRYVFGSDEYPEFVNSSYNDVFGFFITSGINPNTGTMYNNDNIALIPGTNTPVTIDNVNDNTNQQYYIDNNQQTGTNTIEYDGFTTVLTAWAEVIPCTNYSIMIGVADAGDHVYDSGVFLEAYSFSSNTITIEKTYSNANVDTMAIEGCNDATITFRIPNTKSTATNIPLSYSGTATAGDDYDPLPGSVTIPAGQDSASITINALLDTLNEPVETVEIIFDRNCTSDTVTAYIKDYTPMSSTVMPGDTVLCSSDSTVLSTSTQDGINPYSYSWSTGDSTNSTVINPSSSTLYTVTTTDQCNDTLVDSLDIKVSKPNVTPDHDSICQGDTAYLTASIPGARSYNWSTGDTTDTIKVVPNTTTGYEVTITDSLGCSDTDTVTAHINPSPNLSVTPEITICEGTTGTLDASGGKDYMWNTGASSPSIDVSPASDATYTVTATNQHGCTSVDSSEVFVNPYPDPQITAPKDTICRGEHIELNASGADAYSWSNGQSGSAIFVSPDESKTYTVTASNIMNGKSCSDTSNFMIEVIRCNTYFIPNAFSPNGDGTNDVLRIKGNFKNVTDFQFIIYDRYGNIVFKTEDYNEGWRGIDKETGEALPMGTYVYQVTIHEGTYEPIELSGSIILLR